MSNIDYSPPIEFIEITANLKDENSDGLYDYIDINLDLDVQYQIHMYISLNVDLIITMTNGEEFYWWANGPAEVDLDVGATSTQSCNMVLVI